MVTLFDHFGWAGHLPLDSVRTPPPSTLSALETL
jgi:tRNA pseudouridine65 synthase